MLKRLIIHLAMIQACFVVHGLSGGMVFGEVLHAQEVNTEHTLRLTAPANQQKATIEEMRWFAGYWVGDGLGGNNEEIWAPPAGGAMMGMYRMVQDGQVKFYEFCQIVEEEGSLTYKIKHFNPDFTGWEEKDGFVGFPLIKIEGQQAWFDGITLKREKDTLKIWVAIGEKDGNAQEAAFNLKLKRE